LQLPDTFLGLLTDAFAAAFLVYLEPRERVCK